MKIRECYQKAKEVLQEAEIESFKVDAEVLLQEVLDCNKAGLYMRLDEEMQDEERFFALLKEREEYKPIAYITGKKEFMGLEFQVDPRVLIPRPETEMLVEQSINELKLSGGPFTILDLGTGSGAIAISIAKLLPEAEVVTVDISPDALEVAKANAENLGVADRLTFLEGDLWQPVGDRKFQAIISNPPYISKKEMRTLEPDVFDYEPHLALVAKENGLEFYHRIIEGLEDHLLPGGFVAVETGWKQASEVAWEMMTSEMMVRTEVRKDYANIERMVFAWRKKE